MTTPEPSRNHIVGDDSHNATSIPSQCELCNQTFPSRSRLFVHLRIDHDLGDALDDCAAAAAASPDAGGTPGDPLGAKGRDRASNLARSALTSADLEAYYRIQSSVGDCGGSGGGRGGGGRGIMTTDDEWAEALRAFRTPLPLAFRINDVPADSAGRALLDRLLASVPPGALEAVPFVPGGMLYVAKIPTRFWTDASRRHLADAQEVGACHRQEVVSALPALILDVKSDHDVLDLCAAPGSKTLQLLDLMRRDAAASAGKVGAKGRPTGMLVANDPARSRLLQLIRRTRRQARSHLITAASDGRYFPTLRKHRGWKLKFHRVLCDVPCSGDGTLRKVSSGGWKKWNAKLAMTLHKLQVRLLVRALQAVKRGGRVVYSTCSLNPLENEAVLVEAIRICTNETDRYRILPLPERLDSKCTQDDDGAGKSAEVVSALWKHSPGATEWLVPDKLFTAETPTVYAKPEDIPAELRRRRGEASMSMFPPGVRRGGGDGSSHANSRSKITEEYVTDHEKSQVESYDNNRDSPLSEELAESLESMLPNAARILPQHMNSGGFFCALVERLPATYYPVCAVAPTATVTEAEAAATPLSASPRPHHGKIYHPVQYARQVRDVVCMNGEEGGAVSQRDGATRCTMVSKKLLDMYIYEGMPTLSAAQEWLRTRNAFVDGISNEAVPLPDVTETEAETKSAAVDGSGCSDDASVEEGFDHDSECEESRQAEIEIKRAISAPNTASQRSALFSPLFKQPHPSLLAEFCDFYGLCSDVREENGLDVSHSKTQVDRFPIEDVVIMGGGAGAEMVTMCAAGSNEGGFDVAFEGEREVDSKCRRGRKAKHFQLCLMSPGLRRLNIGGAKFSPVEAGLGLCFVPVLPVSTQNDCTENGMNGAILSAPPPSRKSSGRYALLDEAVEVVGRYATKRVVALSQQECVKLLESSFLDIEEGAGNGRSQTFHGEEATNERKARATEAEASFEGAWIERWGRERLEDIANWDGGGVIAVARCSSGSSRHVLTAFLSCVLRDDPLAVDGQAGDQHNINKRRRRLEMLTDSRLSQSLLRVITGESKASITEKK